MWKIVEPHRTKHRSRLSTTIVLSDCGHNYFSLVSFDFDFADDCQS